MPWPVAAGSGCSVSSRALSPAPSGRHNAPVAGANSPRRTAASDGVSSGVAASVEGRNRWTTTARRQGDVGVVAVVSRAIKVHVNAGVLRRGL